MVYIEPLSKICIILLTNTNYIWYYVSVSNQNKGAPLKGNYMQHSTLRGENGEANERHPGCRR